MNAIVHPNDPPVTVNIRAVNPGSFDILLKLISETDSVLTSSAVSAGANLSNLVQIFAGIIRFARHRSRSELVETTESPGSIKATFDDGAEIEFPSQVLGLYENYRIRHQINEIVRPVDGVGIEIVTIKKEDFVVERVTHEDVESLAAPTRPLVSSLDTEGVEREVWLEVVSPTFKAGNSWRVSDGASSFPVKIIDESILAVIDAGEPFRKGDQLGCILHEVQWTDSGGSLKNRREVVQLLDHKKGEFQPRLDGI
jgi:hypothetical protein